MPPTESTTAQLALSLLGLSMISAMVGAWAWAIGRLATGRSLLPPLPSRVVPWRGKQVVGMLLLSLGLQLVVPPMIFGLAGVKSARDANGKVDPGLGVLATMAVNVVFLVVGPWLLIRWTKARPADFGIEPGKVGRDAWRGVVAYALLAPIVYGVMKLAMMVWKSHDHTVKQMVEANPTPLTWALAAISATILAPLAEEFLFRGVLLGGFGRWASGQDRPKPVVGFEPETVEPADGLEPEPAFARGARRRFLAANVAVSLFFAAMHFQAWPSPIPLFFLSMGLGVLYQRTGGLAAPVVLHATFNGTSTLMLFLLYQANPESLKNPDNPIPAPTEASRSLPDADRVTRPRPFRIGT